MAHEDDGDIHVDLGLLPSEAHLLNEANVAADDDVHVTSNQPGKEATASDGAHSWSDETGSSGSVTILLFDTPAGSTITVTVGAASCSTTAT